MAIKTDLERTKIMLTEDNVDGLLKIIDNHLVHNRSLSENNYTRGYIKGVDWVRTEIMKMFER